jgi:hypothetical protein
LDGQGWTNASKSSGAYTTDPEIGAEFAQFGDRIIAALGVSDPMQSYLLSSSSAFADLAAGGRPGRGISR